MVVVSGMYIHIPYTGMVYDTKDKSDLMNDEGEYYTNLSILV